MANDKTTELLRAATDQVVVAFSGIVRTKTLEDRREYDVETLMVIYDLQPHEATQLYGIIQSEFEQ